MTDIDEPGYEPEICRTCAGVGWLLYPTCCGRILWTGECCGDPEPGQAQCLCCEGRGFV